MNLYGSPPIGIIGEMAVNNINPKLFKLPRHLLRTRTKLGTDQILSNVDDAINFDLRQRVDRFLADINFNEAKYDTHVKKIFSRHMMLAHKYGLELRKEHPHVANILYGQINAKK
mgnify:CR=1 FL=1